MIHYHGTPLTPERAAAQVFRGRHVFASHAYPEQLVTLSGICSSFALDNGAFSAWRGGVPVTDWQPFYEWVAEWQCHPAFDWYLIPDVIDGTERDNDALVSSMRLDDGVPVWHLHETFERITRLIDWGFDRIALGSSGAYANVGSPAWWNRMNEAMTYFCYADGRPRVRLHGLRMLNPDIFRYFPFASADSTNVARNVGLDNRWHGTYTPNNPAVRGEVICMDIEQWQSAPVWRPAAVQGEFALESAGAA